MIAQAVSELREHLARGEFPDAEAPEHHNMRSMRLGRNDRAYAYLADPAGCVAGE